MGDVGDTPQDRFAPNIRASQFNLDEAADGLMDYIRASADKIRSDMDRAIFLGEGPLAEPWDDDDYCPECPHCNEGED